MSDLIYLFNCWWKTVIRGNPNKRLGVYVVFYLEMSKLIRTFVKKNYIYTLLYTVKIYLYGNKFQNT
jgi:hypothetical protein